MAYQTGSATSLQDLLSKLNTFLTANGWTIDEFDTSGGDWAVSKNNIFVSGRWDTTAPQWLSLHQALAFAGMVTLPGDHTDDSGNGYNTNSSHLNTFLDNERSVNLQVNGPYPAYHFFENDASPAYVHVVVEVITDQFVHFGFGEIEKVGDWTGGEYVYGQKHSSTTGLTTSSSWLLDGGLDNSSTDEQFAATLHMEGLPGMGVSEKWGQVWGSTVGQPNDTAGNAKVIVQGGYRGGPIAHSFGVFGGSNTSGLIPSYPIGVWYRDIANNRAYFLGFQADVRATNMKNFAPGEEVVIGSDTWVFFPASIRTLDPITFSSRWLGIAYKKVTA